MKLTPGVSFADILAYSHIHQILYITFPGSHYVSLYTYVPVIHTCPRFNSSNISILQTSSAASCKNSSPLYTSRKFFSTHLVARLLTSVDPSLLARVRIPRQLVGVICSPENKLELHTDNWGHQCEVRVPTRWQLSLCLPWIVLNCDC